MKLRKVFGFMFCVLMLSSFIVGCSGNNKANNIDKSLCGRYVSKTMGEETADLEFSLELKENSEVSFYMEGMPKAVSGNWSVEGDVVKIKVAAEGDTLKEMEAEKIGEDLLISDILGTGLNITFVKQNSNTNQVDDVRDTVM